MTAPDPAERRTVIRGAIECAIGLNPTVRPRQAAPLVASVWRIVEPALAQRDRQVEAVRDVIDAMDGVTGARMWAQQLHTALGTRPGGARPPVAWCGASTPGLFGNPIGPCVLRAGHDGSIHQASTGTKWWPAGGGMITMPEPMTDQEINSFREAWTAKTPAVQPPLLDDADPPIDLGAFLGVRTFAEITQDSIDPAVTHPEPLDGAAIYEELVRIYGGPLPPYTPPPKDACACGGTKTLHAPDCPIHPTRLRAIEERLTALLPEEARAAGLHFAYDTTPEDSQ